LTISIHSESVVIKAPAVSAGVLKVIEVRHRVGLMLLKLAA
jgi:hypothetical protein